MPDDTRFPRMSRIQPCDGPVTRPSSVILFRRAAQLEERAVWTPGFGIEPASPGERQHVPMHAALRFTVFGRLAPAAGTETQNRGAFSGGVYLGFSGIRSGGRHRSAFTDRRVFMVDRQKLSPRQAEVVAVLTVSDLKQCATSAAAAQTGGPQRVPERRT
jgi:hypothetical protein